MEALGVKLKEARKSRNLDLDQISRETNITRRYLEALEEEDFTVFPGEPYLLGFLRNYAEYLGLDSNELLSLYKNLRIQESPVPLSELMPRRTIADQVFASGLIYRVLAIAGIVLVAGGVIFGGIALGRKIHAFASGSGETVESRQPVTYDITEDGFRNRVYAGDSLTVHTDSGIFRVGIEETAPSLRLETPTGPRVIDLGQDLTIDLSGDDIPDVRVFVADLFKNDPSRGADVHVSTGAEVAGTVADALSGETGEPGEGDVELVTESESPAAGGSQVLFEGGSAYPVTMTATFRGYCLFRHEADRTNREERYYQKSEQLTLQAKNGIRIWASNGNAVKIQMIAGGKTVDLPLSRPGEVVVRDLKWIRDEESGRFKFMVLDID